MKKIVALLLALLLTASVALAESQASVVRLRELTLSYVNGGRARTARFPGVSVSLAMGESGGGTAIQASFDNGAGTQVDAVARIAGSELLFSMGGISGVFYVDLSRFADSALIGTLTQLLPLASAHLDTLLMMMTVDDGNGGRLFQADVPTGEFTAAADALLSMLDDVDGLEDADVDALRSAVESVDDRAQLTFIYNPASGAASLTVAQGERVIRLECAMEMTGEPFTFFEFGVDEERYDLLNLSQEVRQQVQGELSLIGMKFAHFADGTGLSAIIP